ncbi:unnamed protein product [Gongylonema pulchrum]|uniref:Bromo domain-containing protein n=1 Tax=Gongylonema pulchrum TaxID=637853 RepID=A0A183CVF6_9BILA|nr:unnamed protein product [Gongylonema pulchrum]
MDKARKTRVEVITRQQLIDAYVRIRTRCDETFIRVYAQMDEQFREVRHVRSLALNLHFDTSTDKACACHETGHMKTNKNCPLYGKDSTKGAVKTIGDIHPVPFWISGLSFAKILSDSLGDSEKLCIEKEEKVEQMRNRGSDKTEGLEYEGHSFEYIGVRFLSEAVALTDEQLEKMAIPSGELIAVEGTKLKISRKLYSHAEMIKKNALRLHIPRGLLEGDGKLGGTTGKPSPSTPADGEEKISMVHGIDNNDDVDPDDDVEIPEMPERPKTGRSRSVASSSAKRRYATDMDDYLFGPQKTVKRIRADPKVSMSIVLNEIFYDLRSVPGCEEIMFPVPDYYSIIKEPMDLQTIKRKISENKYELRRQFLYDVKLIMDNSILYNGVNHPITTTAKNVINRFGRYGNRFVVLRDHFYWTCFHTLGGI